jgi:Domain of unknown function (DUF4407)
MLNPLKYFFWACSGSTISHLKTKDCETEHSKYVGIGAAVFLTGVLAAVAATYAFSTVLHSDGWAVALGLLWGAMIFNLDRYLVLSIRNKAPLENASWRTRVGGWLGVLLVALPRVALAALLAVVITKPLELLIFKEEIALEMPSLQADQAKQFQQELETELDNSNGTTLAARIQKLKDENKQLDEQIQAKQAEQQKARQAAVDEALGLATLPPGEGKVFELKKKIADAKELEAKAFIEPRQELVKINNDNVQTLTKQQQDLAKRAEQLSQGTNGLATQLQAFSRLTKKNPPIWQADFVIMAIVLILEIAPILTKFYAKYGPYDKLVDVAEAGVYLRKDLELEYVKRDMETRRESYGVRKQILTDIQDAVRNETMEETRNPKHGSTSYVNLQRAKTVLIETATGSLTNVNENGNKEDS